MSLIHKWLQETRVRVEAERRSADRRDARKRISRLLFADVEVLRMVCNGHSTRAIDKAMNGKNGYTDRATRRIKDQLEVSSLSEAAVIAARANIV